MNETLINEFSDEMGRILSTRPYLVTAVCVSLLSFFTIIAFAQGSPPGISDPITFEYIVKVLGYAALFFSTLAVATGYIWNLWRQKNVEDVKETGETWKKLAESRKEEVLELRAENAELKNEKAKLVKKTVLQKKVILRQIAKLELEGLEIIEGDDDEGVL